MDKLIVTQWRGKVCMVVSSKNGIIQIMMESEGSSSLLNNIYIRKIQKVVDNINAVFVDIGDDGTGYCSLDENKEHISVSQSTRKLKIGDGIVVQVSRDAVKVKAPVLTRKLAFTGRYRVLTIGKIGAGSSTKIGDNGYKARTKAVLKEVLSGGEESLGVIVRTNGAGVADEVLLKEYEHLEGLYCELAAKVFCRVCYSRIYRAVPGYINAIRDSYSGTLDGITAGISEYHRELKAYLEQHQAEDIGKLLFYENKLLLLIKLYSTDTVVKRALGKHVWPKFGGYLAIESTEAIMVIDVNTGRYAGKKNMREIIYRINMEAAEKIGRQLRLRNLSGIILTGFIDMEQEEDREMLIHHLGGMVSRDPVKTTVMDMTRLNLVEATRKKVRELLYGQIFPPSDKTQ